MQISNLLNRGVSYFSIHYRVPSYNSDDLKKKLLTVNDRNSSNFVDAADLQERTKSSIQRQYKHCLANDWLTSDKAKALPLKKFYVDLQWTKFVKNLENYGVSISSIYDILRVLDSSKKPRAFNILLEGTCFFDIDLQ